MTITLRAEVRQSTWIKDRTPVWFAHARAFNESGEPVALRSSAPHDSHAEAMEAAYKILADLDQELMTEVHESRSSRWEARVKQIADEAAGLNEAHPPLIPMTPLSAQIIASDFTAHPRLISVALTRPGSGRGFIEQIDPRFTTTDPHTMEATA